MSNVLTIPARRGGKRAATATKIADMGHDFQRDMVRQDIQRELGKFRGAEMSDGLRRDMKNAALKEARRSAHQWGIPAPRVAIDRSPEDPLQIVVRIAWDDPK